jgi:hypothetical protein
MIAMFLLAFTGTSVAVAMAHPLVDARVKIVDHCPALLIAGRRVPPLALYVYINFQVPLSVSQSAAEIQLAARHGINIVTFPVGLPNPHHPFIHRSIQRLCAFILKNNPRAWLLPRIWCGVPGFDARHPCQLVKYADGQRPQCSPESRIWYHAVANDLKLFVAYVKASPILASRVIGYHICHGNTGEWFTPSYWGPERPGFDYSTPNRAGFRRWLRQRYQTNTALEAAWHDPSIRFASASVPAPQKSQHYPFYRPDERRYVDYMRYQSDMAVRRISQFARVIKRETAGRSLVVTFYGYGFSLPTPNSSDEALGKLLRCPYINAVACPVDYAFRQPGGAPPLEGAQDSAALHGKLWMMEDDTSTFLDTTKHSGPGFYARCANLNQTIDVHRRNFGQVLIHRMGMWWMDLQGKGWLNSSGIWDNIGSLRRVYNRLGGKSQYKPDVAVILDERSSYYARVGPVDMPLLGALTFNPGQFFRCGTSVGCYLLSDVANHEFPPAKVIIFLNAWHVNAAERREIKARLESRGRTLIWLYGAGFLTHGKIDAAAAGRLVGMKLRLLPPSSVPGSQVIAGNKLGLPPQHLSGLNAAVARFGIFSHAVDTPSFAVVSPSAIALADYDHSSFVSVALVRHKHYSSIFIGDPRPSAAFWRSLFPHLGVPVYLNTNDAFETDGRLMMISSDGVAGNRTIHLPSPSTVYNLVGGERLASNVMKFVVRMRRYQTKLLRIVPMPHAQ